MSGQCPTGNAKVKVSITTDDQYRYVKTDGKVPTDLDECGGHTHKLDGVEVYHYHLPDEFPWIIGCFTGCPEVSNNRNEFRDLSKYGC